MLTAKPLMANSMRLNNLRRPQQGGFLLEALIGILIFSFGILGIVGLQAQSLRNTGDSEYRAEATYLANSLISKMWADDQSTLQAKYDSSVGTGQGYADFASAVANLPGVVIGTPSTNAPIVLVDPPAPEPQTPSVQGHIVEVTVFWKATGDTVVHKYSTTGIVGTNPN